MLKGIWSWIEKIVVLWGFLTIAAIALDAANILPYYDIYYAKKEDIVPKLQIYPGQRIQLSPHFYSAVDSNRVEVVEWTIRGPSGKELEGLPKVKDIRVKLRPDLIGPLKVSVRAKIQGEAQDRYGEGVIQVVQDEPYEISSLKENVFIVPENYAGLNVDSIQFYNGDENWIKPSIEFSEQGFLKVIPDRENIKMWNGNLFVRYKSEENADESYEVQEVNVFDIGSGSLIGELPRDDKPIMR